MKNSFAYAISYIFKIIIIFTIILIYTNTPVYGEYCLELSPYCNILNLNILQRGLISGTDNDCGFCPLRMGGYYLNEYAWVLFFDLKPEICEHPFEYSIIIGSGSTGELYRYYPNGDLFPGDPLPIELIDDQVDLTAQNMNMSISSIETLNINSTNTPQSLDDVSEELCYKIEPWCNKYKFTIASNGLIKGTDDDCGFSTILLSGMYYNENNFVLFCDFKPGIGHTFEYSIMIGKNGKINMYRFYPDGTLFASDKNDCDVDDFYYDSVKDAYCSCCYRTSYISPVLCDESTVSALGGVTGILDTNRLSIEDPNTTNNNQTNNNIDLAQDVMGWFNIDNAFSVTSDTQSNGLTQGIIDVSNINNTFFVNPNQNNADTSSCQECAENNEGSTQDNNSASGNKGSGGSNYTLSPYGGFGGFSGLSNNGFTFPISYNTFNYGGLSGIGTYGGLNSFLFTSPISYSSFGNGGLGGIGTYGFSGLSGLSGFSGLSGLSGFSGLSGLSGFSGTSFPGFWNLGSYAGLDFSTNYGFEYSR